jgi:hypothetical protein
MEDTHEFHPAKDPRYHNVSMEVEGLHTEAAICISAPVLNNVHVPNDHS